MTENIQVETGYELVDTHEDDAAVEAKREKAGKKTAFDVLAASLQKPVELEPIIVPIPSRPNISLRFDVNIDSFRLQHWTERAIRKVAGKPKADPRALACMVIANQLSGIFVGGEEVFDEDGDPITFRGDTLKTMLGVDTITNDRTETVRALIGSDGHIFQINNRIMDAAGYSDDDVTAEEDDENPTT